MSRSELVTTDHLTRKAVIYIRQSTPHQVLTNQESLHLQYALRQRAIHLGWRNDHQGHTRSSRHHPLPRCHTALTEPH
jgi:hypothetical protein